MKIKKFKLKKVVSKNGTLTVAQIKFPIRRIFTVIANKNSERGFHAHKKCRQILFCPYGKIRVNLFDGFSKKNIILSKSQNAILIPTFTWATQKFLLNNSVLVVLCDKLFSENEYIRNIDKFRKIKKKDA